MIHKILGRFPCVEVAGEVGLVAISHVREASAALAKHEEGTAIETFALILFRDLEELGDKRSIESKARDMACSVDTEAVDTHLDEIAILLNEVLRHGGVLGVKVDTVTCDLTPPAVGKVPVPACTYVMPIVVVILVGAVGVLQVGEASVKLLGTC